jgi:hypothetical protein
MRQGLHSLLALAVMCTAAALLVFAQGTPQLDQGYAGAAMVSGRASPGQAPVTIYDTSSATRTILGSSQSIDGAGNFAASVNPPLILGHRIVVVDHSGATSPAMVVDARLSSASH